MTYLNILITNLEHSLLPSVLLITNLMNCNFKDINLAYTVYAEKCNNNIQRRIGVTLYKLR